MKQEDIGAFIANLRKERGWTQKEMASKLGVSDKAISKWETGKSLPDMGILIPVSELLGITVDELLSGEKRDTSKDGAGNEPNKAIIDYAAKIIERTKKNYRLIPATLLGVLVLTVVILSGLGYSFGLNAEPESPLKEIVERNPISTIGKAVMTDEEEALSAFANGAGRNKNYLSYRLAEGEKLSSIGVYIFDGTNWSSDPIITNGESHMGLISFTVVDGVAEVGLYEADGFASYSAERPLAGLQKSWDTGTVSTDAKAEISGSGMMVLSAWIATDGEGIVSIDVLGKNDAEWMAYRGTMENYNYVVALYMVVD